MRGLAVGLALALTGCATSAAYERRGDSGDLTGWAHCHRPAAEGFWLATGVPLIDAGLFGLVWGPLYAVDSIQKGRAYADCKTDLEAQGYTRPAPGGSR